MNQNAQAVVGVVAVLVVLPLLLLWLGDRLRRACRARKSPAEIAAERAARLARVRQPDWAFYERHLQRPVPAALREFYADEFLLTHPGSLACPPGDRINSINPLFPEELIERNPVLPFDILSIATTDFGDEIYLRPGPREPDTVYVIHHDGGDVEEYAASVAEMLATVRKHNPPPPPGQSVPA